MDRSSEWMDAVVLPPLTCDSPIFELVAAAWMKDFASIKSSFPSLVTSLVDQAYTNFSQYPDLKNFRVLSTNSNYILALAL